MIKNREWFKSLPFGLVVKMAALYLVRKLTRIPVSFSYAQGAEDIIIQYLLKYHVGVDGPGNYVDVGCNAPIRYSNTFHLYLTGWRGINIDANAELIKECQKVRLEDVCVHAAVSDTEREAIFHRAKSDLVSTIDETRLVDWKKHFEFVDDDQERVVTRTLTSILDEHWTHGNSIDVLSIDVEGHDFPVLKSIDLSRYRPRIIVIEMHSVSNMENTEVYQYLFANGFEFKFYAVLNAYFTDSRDVENKSVE